MGKKKNKVKRKNGKNMSKKMKKYEGYKKMKKKKIDPTISKKEAKELNKVLEKSFEIPELKKVRKKCNHNLKKSSAFVSAAEFEGENEYLVRDLEGMIRVFGEENVGICSTCLVAVPSMAALTVEDLENSILAISGAAEHIVANTSNEKEIEATHKALRDAVDNIKLISKKYAKLRAKRIDDEDTTVTSTSSKGIDYSQITQ